MTIQYIMLVSLGFLIASLITLLLAPIFWQRAVRLTSNRLRQALPLSEQEILADKDHLRAKYAIRVHQLEKQVETSSLGAARQKIDLNRRDAAISQLETDITSMKGELEENQNARGVLEQTVSDRIPKIEARLEEARKLLLVRDREIGELSQSSRRQQAALNDAQVVNQKQATDIERFRSQVLAYEAQIRKGPADAGVETELAIRTELEMLRSRSRDQASLIDRLNAEISVGRANSAPNGAGAGLASGGNVVSLGGGELAAAAGPVAQDLEAELRREIAVLRLQLEQAKTAAEASAAANRQAAGIETAVERELRMITTKAEDQAVEITRLRTELAAVAAESSAGDSSQPSLRENRIALKARLSGLEVKSNHQAEIIQRLRTELAQANERAARQSANLMDEMRRVGMAPNIVQPRAGGPPEPAARVRTVSKRTQALLEGAGGPAQNSAQSLAQNAAQSTSGQDGAANDTGGASPPPATLGRRLVASSRATTPGVGVAESHAVVGGMEAATGTAQSVPPARVGNLVAALRGSATNGEAAGTTLVPPRATASSVSGSAEPGDPAAAPRQPRLVDRITAAEGKS